jgi:hypothetical protein
VVAIGLFVSVRQIMIDSTVGIAQMSDQVTYTKLELIDDLEEYHTDPL